MKTGIKLSRFIIITLLLTALVNEAVYSQGTDSRKTYSNRDKLYLGIILVPQTTAIKNEGFSTFKLASEKSNSINYGIEGGYFFSKFAGIIIGAGMSSYSGKSSLDSYSTSFTTKDIENESFEMRISGNTISEDQKVSFMSIPVCLNLRYSAGKKLGFYVRGGTSFNIPLVKSFNGSGIFTYEGYYPAYPVLLQNLPLYGFPSNVNTNSSGTLEIKSISLGLTASGGTSFYLNDLFQLSLGVYFNKSLGSISGYKSDSNFKLTTKANELKSIMEGSSAADVQAFGVSIGFRYYLK
jgi:hypothetical protein